MSGRSAGPVIVGVLLAAGSSRRFGGHKLLHPLPDGQPIALRSAGTLMTGVDAAIAVVRPADQALGSLLGSAGLRVVACPSAERGVGASLAAGIAAAPHADAWIIALADMPFVRPETVLHVARLLRAGVVLVAPVYLGRRGHPVGFGRCWGDSLMALEGDTGARALLAHAQLTPLETDDPGVIADVDTPADLAAFLASGMAGS